jgi:hypothetical protein
VSSASPGVRIGRQCHPSGIVSAGEFHQCRDPRIHRRMRREQVGKSLAGIVDAHLHDGRTSRRAVRRDSRSCAAPRSWRRDSWSAPPSPHRPAIRASATARSAPPATGAQASAISATAMMITNHRAAAGAFAVAVRRGRRSRRSAAAEVEPGIDEYPEEQFSRKADHAGDDDGDHHQLHVAIADMRQLVAEHRFHLVIVERAQEARRDRDGILPGVQAGGEGVQRISSPSPSASASGCRARCRGFQGGYRAAAAPAASRFRCR